MRPFPACTLQELSNGVRHVEFGQVVVEMHEFEVESKFQGKLAAPCSQPEVNTTFWTCKSFMCHPRPLKHTSTYLLVSGHVVKICGSRKSQLETKLQTKTTCPFISLLTVENNAHFGGIPFPANCECHTHYFNVDCYNYALSSLWYRLGIIWLLRHGVTKLWPLLTWQFIMNVSLVLTHRLQKKTHFNHDAMAHTHFQLSLDYNKPIVSDKQCKHVEYQACMLYG